MDFEPILRTLNQRGRCCSANQLHCEVTTIQFAPPTFATFNPHRQKSSTLIFYRIAQKGANARNKASRTVVSNEGLQLYPPVSSFCLSQIIYSRDARCFLSVVDIAPHAHTRPPSGNFISALNEYHLVLVTMAGRSRKGLLVDSQLIPSQNPV